MLNRYVVNEQIIIPVLKVIYNYNDCKYLDLFFLDQSYNTQIITVEYEDDTIVVRETPDSSKMFTYEDNAKFFKIKRDNQELFEYVKTTDFSDCEMVDRKEGNKIFAEAIRHKKLHNEFEKVLNENAYSLYDKYGDINDDITLGQIRQMIK